MIASEEVMQLYASVNELSKLMQSTASDALVDETLDEIVERSRSVHSFLTDGADMVLRSQVTYAPAKHAHPDVLVSVMRDRLDSSVSAFNRRDCKDIAICMELLVATVRDFRKHVLGRGDA